MPSKKPTWTRKGVTHQRHWGTTTICGLQVPYKLKAPNKKTSRNKGPHIARDKKPRQVTCVVCLAEMEATPMHLNITDALRGLSHSGMYLDEAK